MRFMYIVKSAHRGPPTPELMEAMHKLADREIKAGRSLQTQVLLEALHKADLPKGLLNVVTGRGDVVGAELVRNPDVAKISFTGSVGAGQSIMRDGAATMKRVTLELGGKSPTILLDDAALDQAIPSALLMAFLNSGQACAAGTRLLVPNSRLDEIKHGIREAMRVFTVGDPADPKTAIGPMVSQKQYERVQSYIRKGIEEGAEVLAGGEGHPEGLEVGYFVKPTVFVNVKNDMTIAQEEIFGPVLCVIAYDSEDEAIRIANDSKYGLHAAVLGTDLPRAHRVASQIRAGRVVINGMTDDPQAPREDSNTPASAVNMDDTGSRPLSKPGPSSKPEAAPP